MNHARLIFEDAPAFIPVPANLQHRRVEAILLPLDDENVAISGLSNTKPEDLPDELLVNYNGEPIPANGQNFPDLSEFHVTLPKQEMSAGEFCRKMRDEDRY